MEKRKKKKIDFNEKRDRKTINYKFNYFYVVD